MPEGRAVRMGAARPPRPARAHVCSSTPPVSRTFGGKCSEQGQTV